MFERERCGGPGGKIIYENRKIARDELARLRRAGRSNCTGVHYCIFCDGYHHTKNERHGKKKKGLRGR